MLAELVHLCRHAPGALALKRKLPQAELYAELIGRADRAGLAERRAELVAGLAGDVVEIGAGTGSMFPYYGPEVRLTAVEPDAAFAAHARAVAGARVTVVEGTGEALPLPDASADAAVLALVLCSVPSMDAVVREVARVVRPGGEVRLLEHVRSERVVAGALMHLANPLWLAVNGQGCRMNRDPLPALARGGIDIDVDRIVRFQIWSAGIPAFPMRLLFGRRLP